LRILVRLPAALVLVILFFGCARQFNFEMGYDDGRIRRVFAEAVQEVADFRGSGVITAVERGKRSSGRCDVRFKSGNDFRAQIYSPFGSTAARIDADSLGVRLSVGKEQYSFMLEESMDAVPFGWGRHFTYAQFIRILMGMMPEELKRLNSRPDSLAFDKKSAVAVWNSDTLTVRAHISRKNETVESVALYYNLGSEAFTLQFGRFKNGLAAEIVISDDSRNYISLKYDTIRID